MFRSKAATLLRQLVQEQTQQPLADALGVEQSTISGYVRGRCRPALARALVLQDRFGIPIDAWVVADDSPEPPARRATGPRGTLTEKQHQIVDFIVAYTAEHGFPPTMREMAEAIGTKSSNSVAGHLLRLQRAGVVTWEMNKPRTVRVLAKPTGAAAE
jgi:repressor LexA